MKIRPIYDKLLEGVAPLTGDQIHVITITDFRGKERYYYNTKLNKFVPSDLISNYDINDFDYTKANVTQAKESAMNQNLNTNVMDLGKLKTNVSHT